MPAIRLQQEKFRIWTVDCPGWRANDWRDVPPQATALEPAAPDAFSRQEAAGFVEGFNRAMLAQGESLWAVAVPVETRLAGDASPGLAVRGTCFANV